MIANEVTRNDTLQQYVTSYHELTLLDSNQVKSTISQIHDAHIVDGMVKSFSVYERPSLNSN